MKPYIFSENITCKMAFSKYEVNKIKLIIRRPQEGKTFIMIDDIVKTKKNNLDIIFTMNTIKANMQLYSRLAGEIGANRIAIINSKKDLYTEYRHFNKIYDIIPHINEIDCIVLCSNKTRIEKSVPELLHILEDSKSFKRDVRIHFDEAHEYIPSNREVVTALNDMDIVHEIIGYSASPKKIWIDYHPLFGSLYIVDVENERSICSSPDYFGVSNVEYIMNSTSVDDIICRAAIDINVPDKVYNTINDSNTKKVWYGEHFPFQLGNEHLYLSFVKLTLPKLGIDPNAFSYNFVPAYTRCATHYMIAELILEQYPGANVIVSNGPYPLALYSRDSIKTYNGKLLEPSEQIVDLIKKTRNRPTFITGFTCVSMSVTLINQDLGNFDNVIMDHNHFTNDDILYQLCRYLFNYTSWSEENRARIKPTKVYTIHKQSYDRCLAYEKMINNINDNLCGDYRTLSEITGKEDPNGYIKYRLKKYANNNKEIFDALEEYVTVEWKREYVFGGNDSRAWKKIEKEYYKCKGKYPTGKARPVPKDGFYITPLTGKKSDGPITNTTIKKHIKGDSWSSLFQLSKSMAYSRIFVSYEDTDDMDEYTIWLKVCTIEDNEDTRKLLDKYVRNKNKITKLNKELKLGDSSDSSDSSSDSSDSSDSSSDSSSDFSDSSDSSVPCAGAGRKIKIIRKK